VSTRRLTARDYKRPRRNGSPRLQAFGLGLALGLLVAGAVYVRDHRAPSAAAEPSHPVPGARRNHHTGADDAGPPDDSQASVDDAAGVGASAAGAGTGGAGAGASASASAGTTPGVGGFDFYRMLPKFEVVVPEHEHGSQPSPAAQIERPGVYFLQVGSYHDQSVAQRIRDQLARQGISATVQRVAVDADVWHRVRVGPIRDLSVLNRLRQQLQASKLDSLVIRVND
jgi:hypothetical protein